VRQSKSLFHANNVIAILPDNDPRKANMRHALICSRDSPFRLFQCSLFAALLLNASIRLDEDFGKMVMILQGVETSNL
jgi:hypothetical protein